MVVGNSMGSIVGGLYAIGYTPEEMDSVVRKTDWIQLLLDTPDYNDQLLTTRKQSETYQLRMALDPERQFSKSGRSGIIRGRNIEYLLNQLTCTVPDSVDFNKLPLPFACNATEVVHGSIYEFHSGNLVKAMRASMAIPGVFTPVEQDTMLFVDGFVADCRMSTLDLPCHSRFLRKSRPSSRATRPSRLRKRDRRNPPKTRLGGDAATASPPAANVTAVHLPGASARLGLGAGSEPLLAASFDDQTPENISEADWRSFFSFVNFFQTLDGFLAFSEASIGHPLWQKLRTASTVQADGAWAEALECAEGDERMTEWLRSLQNDGTPPPEVFADLARPDGEVVGCALMFWADKRLAIVEDAVDASVLGKGWTILSVPEDGSDDKVFIKTIMAALAAS